MIRRADAEHIEIAVPVSATESRQSDMAALKMHVADTARGLARTIVDRLGDEGIACGVSLEEPEMLSYVAQESGGYVMVWAFRK